MIYCEILSGIWIGDVNIMHNNDFIKDNNITTVINCTIDYKFPDVLNKIRISLPDNYQQSIDILNSSKDKIIDLIYKNMDDHNILITCYDGNNISPYIISLFLLKYGGSKINKNNIKNIIKSKHEDISMDFDLSVYGM